MHVHAHPHVCICVCIHMHVHALCLMCAFICINCAAASTCMPCHGQKSLFSGRITCFIGLTFVDGRLHKHVINVIKNYMVKLEQNVWLTTFLNCNIFSVLSLGHSAFISHLYAEQYRSFYQVITSVGDLYEMCKIHVGCSRSFESAHT